MYQSASIEPTPNKGTNPTPQTSKASLLIKGDMVTNTFILALGNQKYCDRIAYHRNISRTEFKDIDWESPADSGTKLKSTSLPNLFKHPTRLQF